MNGSQSQFRDQFSIEGPPSGWNLHDSELVRMVDTIIDKYRGDPNRVYLTGLSYGGIGVWWMARKYPERFAAANLIDSIADAEIPVWCFAGGRDLVVPVAYFYPGMNKLEELSAAEVRFTVE
jgi:predicted peptidase